jgi:hypothetical protein
MYIVILSLIVLSVVPALLIARSVINMRKRLTNAEESKQNLKAGLEARLRAEERNRRDLEEKLYKAEEEYKRLEEELKRKAEKEEEQRRIQKEEGKKRLVEKEGREKAEKEKLERLEAERLQLEKQLSQAVEERKYLADEFQKVEGERDRIEEERRKLQEGEHRWQAEREVRDIEGKKINEKLEAQRRELEERIHEANEERNCLKETIREAVKSIEDLRQKHAKEEQQWKSEIEAWDKAQKEMMEKFDTERRHFEEKLLKAEVKLKGLEEEIKQQIEKEEERRRQQAEEEQRRRAEGEKLNKAQWEIIDQLEAECQQLKKRLSKADEERKYFEEGLKGTAEVALERSEIEKLKQLEVERKQLEERLSKSEEKRKRLINKLKQIEPMNRGGRSRKSREKTEVNDSPEGTIRSIKPEIICWKEGWSWIIGIELPEGLEARSVSQDGLLLECDIANGNRYPLKQPESRVKITWSEGSELIPLLRPERDYIIFKMRNNWKGPGRLVRYCTAGYYLIIAPQDWERDIEISGSASVAPESTQFGGFKAHFFYQEKTEIAAIGLITMDGKRVQVDSKSPRFKLVGNEISDASEDKGPLFAEQPPLIQALNGIKGWSDVEIIVVGEEGSGRNKWRDSFAPNVSVEEQTNLDMLINGRSGWYFLRIYDKNNDLIESMDFRFFRNLRNIQIEGNTSCLPGLLVMKISSLNSFTIPIVKLYSEIGIYSIFWIFLGRLVRQLLLCLPSQIAIRPIGF